MKKIVTNRLLKRLMLVVLTFFITESLFSQVSVTATGGTTGPTSYATVNASFAAINSGTHQGVITITVTANTTEPATPIQLLRSGAGLSNYQSVKIIPSGDRIINSAATPTASRGILEFVGADSVTIEGDDPLTPGVRNLTIQMATTTNVNTACVRFSSSASTSDGCKHATVKNCIIIGGRTSPTITTVSFGIFSGLSTAASTITTGSGSANNDSMLLENNSIQRCYYGIYTYGLLTTYVQNFLRIRNNVIGNSNPNFNVGFRGIFTANTQLTANSNSVLIEGNDVQGGDTLTGWSATIAGIDLNISNAGAIIRNNNIHDIAQPTSGGWGAYGIFISNVTNNANISIHNNFIRDIWAFHYTSSVSTFVNYGIYCAVAATNLRINHNTIVLNKPNAGSGTANFSACVLINNATATVAEFRNNILVNNQSDNTGQACLNVFLNTGNIFANAPAVNKNNYWVSGQSGYVGRVGTTNYATLANWKALTNKDSASLNFSPEFVSNTNLHLVTGQSSPFESAGDFTSIVTDIDGDVRPGPSGSIHGGGSAPDIGADEADCALPSLASMFTGGRSNVTTNSATLNGGINNNGGSNIISSGIVISTSPSPIRGGFGVIDSATNPAVLSGSFSVNVTGLNLGTTYYYRSYAVNGIGTAYGPDSVFTTNASASVATVVRTGPTNISAFGATVGGNITSDGGSAVYISGVVYATFPNPTVGFPGVVDSTTNPVVATGNYSFNIGGLLAGTKYYFRAYATNGVGTAYSVQDSLTTSPVINVLPYTQNFDSAGNTGWSSGTIGTGINNWVLGTPAKTFINGAYSAPNSWVTKLTGNYDNNADGGVVSPQFSFNNLTADPLLRFRYKFQTEGAYDGAIVEISINGGTTWTKLDNATGTGTNFNTANSTAWYNGNVFASGLGSAFQNTSNAYATQSNGWIQSQTVLTGAAGQSNVKIRFRFASDGSVNGYDGVAFDNIEVFSPSAPTVATGTRTNVTTASATLAGSIIDNGGSTVTASGVVIATTPNPVRGGFGVTDSATNPLVASGNFTVNVDGLFSATQYYYRSYAVNAVGTTYGPDSSFITNASATQATVLRTGPSNLSAYNATVGGNITSDGGSPVFVSGVVFATFANPTLGFPGVVDSTTNPVVTTGNYSFNLGGLLAGTKYYFRAYATNGVGTAYSGQDSFTTSPVINLLPYTQNFDSAGNTGWSSGAIGTGINNWVLGTPAKTFLNGAFSAPNSWVTKLTGNYDNSADGGVVSPQFNFNSLTADPLLRFRYKFQTEGGWDGAIVEISLNGGTTWTKLDNATGTGTNFNTANSTAWYNGNVNASGLGSAFQNTSSAYATQSNGWIQSQTKLTGAAGQSNVKVRFRFASDGSVNGYDGVAFDNIEVFSPSAPTVATGTRTNVTTASATLAGSVIDNGGSVVTASGVVIATTPNPVRGGFGVTDSATNPLVASGNFTVNVDGLFSATQYYYRSYAVNAVGTTYGPDSTFITNASAVPATVLKTGPSNVSAFAATVGGNITSDGGSNVFISGVVFATFPNPTLGFPGVVDSTTNPLVALGNYSFNLSGLTHSTKYYFRAYATNGVGTAYSNQDSFTTAPVVNTLPYFQNFDSVGNTGWSTAAIGAAVNDWQLGTPSKLTLSSAFSAPNAYVTRLTGNYSNSANCVVESPQFDFTSVSATPVLKFVHKFQTENAWDGGAVEISLNGGTTWTKLDNLVGTGTNFNTANSTAWYNGNVNGQTLGSGFVNQSTAYASNSSGWITSTTPLTGAANQSNVKVRFRFASDGSVNGFDGWAVDNIEVIVPSAPTVATGSTTNLISTNATLAGNIISNGNSAITASGIVYSTSPSPTRGGFGVADSATSPLVTNGNFTVNVGGLFPATFYYYRAYAVNALGTSYGADSTFITPSSAVVPFVNSVAASNIGENNATAGGNIVSNGGATITESGLLLSLAPNPVKFGVGVIDSITNPLVSSGNYAFSFAGLIPATKYYFRAYALNTAGYGYSNQDSFTTAPIVSSFPYMQNFDVNPASSGWSAVTVTGTINDWQLGTPNKPQITAAASGANAWVTKISGNYSDNHNAALVSPRFNFTSLGSDPIVRFKHNFGIEAGWDAGLVEFSINNGTTWVSAENAIGNPNTANSINWYNGLTNGFGNAFQNTSTTGYGTTTNGWISSAVRLPGANGQANVRVRFRFASDGFVNLANGWAIDDIEVYTVVKPTVQASNVVVSALSTNSATLTWTNGNGDGRVVVGRLSTGANANPTDWVNYNANAAFGSGGTTGAGNFVLYKGTANTVNITGLANLTNYTFRVYEYNGTQMHVRFDSAGATVLATTPVTLLNFNAAKVDDNVNLNWVTANEVNNSGFDLQRSVDGINFKTIGFVKGNGTTRTTSKYDYVDYKAFSMLATNTIYYRLKQIDFDGQYTYSNIAIVNANDELSDVVNAYPNPFTTNIGVDIKSTENTVATIAVRDILGKLVSNESVNVLKGNNYHPLNNLSALANGVYFVGVTLNGKTQVVKITKAN